jgi:hypothetical protein
MRMEVPLRNQHRRKEDRGAPRVAIDSPLVMPPASRVVPRLLACAESLGTPYKRTEALAFGFGDSPEGSLYYCPVSLLSDLWQTHSLPIVLAHNLSRQLSEEKIYKLLFPPPPTFFRDLSDTRPYLFPSRAWLLFTASLIRSHHVCAEQPA